VLDESLRYCLLASQGGMHPVRSLKLRVRRYPEERLEVHDGIFLLSDEITDG
jgi:hypothetical protein